VLDAGIDGLRVGFLDGYFREGVDKEVARAVAAAVEDFATLGAHVSEVSLPLAAAAYEATCEIMIRAEALALHEERLLAHPELFGDDVRRRLELGRNVSGVQYARAAETVRIWQAEVNEMFNQVDLLLCPTAPDPAPEIHGAETITTTQRLTRLAFPISAAELPAISLPCGFTQGGLPIGLMVVAARWCDTLPLRAGCAFQERTDWHWKRPPVPASTPNSPGSSAGNGR
jgi:aspartyl-tRNA(Asn)/glutamyl-tRNA(Gln) amidotransferase subunit A